MNIQSILNSRFQIMTLLTSQPREKLNFSLVTVAQPFNPVLGRQSISLSLKQAWFKSRVAGQPRLQDDLCFEGINKKLPGESLKFSIAHHFKC